MTIDQSFYNAMYSIIAKNILSNTCMSSELVVLEFGVSAMRKQEGNLIQAPSTLFLNAAISTTVVKTGSQEVFHTGLLR